jgi:hypothetical protein
VSTWTWHDNSYHAHCQIFAFLERQYRSLSTMRQTADINAISTMRRQTMYYNVRQTRSRKHCCRGKQNVLNIVSVCVRVALVTQQTKRIPHTYCDLWPVWQYKILHIISLRKRFSKKKKLLNINCAICLSLRLWNISHS